MIKIKFKLLCQSSMFLPFVFLFFISAGLFNTLGQTTETNNPAVISENVVFPEKTSTPVSEITGELRQWHKVTLTIDGPRSSQYGQTVFRYNDDTRMLDLDVRPQAGPGGRLGYMHPNPFLDYRMTVTFSHESGSPVYRVPGYFAADGNAEETGAMSGKKWRVHLSPDKTGRWNWEVEFVAGVDVAIEDNKEGQPYLPYHGMNGSFHVEETDKEFPDFRSRGRLRYVGGHYLQFAGNGEYFLKAGTDAPETLLAYADFDGTKTMMTPDQRGWIGPANGHGLHEYAAHKQDWREGDPVWHGGKGRGLIGAVNYLADQGMNAISFIPHTAGGDGENVWPWVCRHCFLNYDISKLAQWEIFFEHAQKMGLFLHFKLQEQENDAGWPVRVRRGANPTVPEALDGGALGRERKLYTRELVARFGHHLALNWNLGEETSVDIEPLKEWAEYIKDTDPYGHHMVIHTGSSLAQHEEVYQFMLGDKSALTGASLQINPYDDAHRRTLRWIVDSRNAGKPWAVAYDEQGPSTYAVPPDPGFAGWDGLDQAGNPVMTIHDIRKYALWGHLMAGGFGVEYYFGYHPPHNDLVAEDMRSRHMSWGYARVALEFFRKNNIPFWEMNTDNNKIGNNDDDNSRFCFAKPGEIYVVYLPEGGTARLDLRGASGNFSVRWYDPRNGGELQTGSVTSVRGGGSVGLGNPPSYADADWVVLIRKN